MSHAPRNDAENGAESDDAELARAHEVLARTMRFLARCAEDPEAAMKSDDPRDLMRGLKSLGVAPALGEASEVPDAVEEQRTIQIRRRRSA